jgi:probable addiction module antidote protein
MKKIFSYHDDLMRKLKDPKYAVGYLNAAFDDEDRRVFLLALRDVVEAQGGMRKFARFIKISREHIYRMLSKKGNPEFKTLLALLDAAGFKLSIESKRPLKKAA